MKKPVIPALITALLSPLYAAADLQVACTEQKPFYYQDNNKNIAGRFYDTTKAVLNRAGISAEYSVMPWNVLYDSSLVKKGLISCMGRTPLNEDSFHWIGPVATNANYTFYQLKSKSAFVSYMEDFKNYKIGIQDLPHMSDFINSKKLNASTQTMETKTQLLLMLKLGRLDFILLEEQDVENEAQKVGLNPGDLLPTFYAYTLVESLAVSKSTPEETVDQLQDAYEALATEGKIVLQ